MGLFNNQPFAPAHPPCVTQVCLPNYGFHIFNGPTLYIYPLAKHPPPRNDEVMFSIEHEFDSTVITLVDEGPTPLKEDVIVNSFAECVTVQQFNPISQQTETMTLSYEQVRDLAAALDLPEGVYTLAQDGPKLSE